MSSMTSAKFAEKFNSLIEECLEIYDNDDNRMLRMLRDMLHSTEMKSKIKSAYHDCCGRESEKIDTESFITGTPINRKNPSTVWGKKAKIDYEREQKESNGFREACKWDDTSTNNSEVGQLFGFVQQGKNVNIIQIHTITRIESNETRINEWDIIPHKIRNVLHLSPMIDQLPWTEFIHKYLPTWKKDCKHILRGTKRCITTYKK